MGRCQDWLAGPGRRPGGARRALFLAVLAAMFGGAGAAHAVPSGCGSPACVNIQGFAGDTFEIGPWNGAANQIRSAVVRHCVFSNRPNSGTKTYNLTPTGVGTAGNAFLLSGPGGDLPYQVEVRDGNGGSIDWTVATAGAVTSFTSLSEANFDFCTDSATSGRGQRVRVTVFETDMEALAAGTYTGTMRFDVATPVGSATDNETSGAISVEIPPLVRLNGLKNAFNFGNWNPDSGGDEVNADPGVCVWSNHSSGHYTVTATTTTGTFEATSGADAVPFAVWWSESAGISTVEASDAELDYGVAATFSTDAATTACTGGDTASVVIAFGEEVLGSAVAGSYSASVTLTVGLAP